MPRYFFNVRDGVQLPDTTGTTLPDIEAARTAAVRASGEAIRELGAKFWEFEGEWQMEVTDEDGNTVVTLRFSSQGTSS